MATNLAFTTTEIDLKPALYDSTAPVVDYVDMSLEWTAFPVPTNIVAHDGETKIVEWGLSTNDEDLSTVLWDKKPFVEFKNNGSFFAYAKDLNGNISSPYEFKIDKIDHIAPVISGVSKEQGFVKGSYSFDVLATDEGSGITAYGISLSNFAQTVVWNTLADNTFEVKANETYYVFAKDAVGNVSKAFEHRVKLIDNEAPTLSFNISADWTNKDISIEMLAEDNGSGVAYILSPSGSSIEAASFNYTFTSNGSYDFTVFDNVGNSTGYNIPISTIDKQAPMLTHTIELNEDSTGGIINITSTDNLSGIDYIILPNGKKTSKSNVTFDIGKDGQYAFVVFDNAGNKLEYTAEVTGMAIPTKQEPKTFAQAAKEVVVAVAKTAAKAAPIVAAGGGSYFLIMFFGADVIVVDDKKKKKHRAWLSPDGTLDLTKINKKTGALHYQIIFSHKWIKAHAGQEITVVINKVAVAKAVVTFDNNVLDV